MDYFYHDEKFLRNNIPFLFQYACHGANEIDANN